MISRMGTSTGIAAVVRILRARLHQKREKPPPVYQRVAPKAVHLQELGMSQAEIGRRLRVDRWTVGKALRWLVQLKRG